jgi:CheY-like chemotaxis protein
MTDDLVSVRILAAFGTAQDRQLLRQVAAMAPVPIDVIATEAAAGGRNLLATNAIDVAFVDATAPPSDLAAFIATAHAMRSPAFVILVAAAAWEAGEFKAGGIGADGIVAKPVRIEQAKVLIDRCIRLRLPTRVLVVDDSATMRSIIVKLLAASRFPLEIEEAQDGIEALKLIASGKFDLVLVDYNMPGLNGIETLMEIKRQHPAVRVVVMTSAQDGTVADRARTAGASAFLKKPFYPADIQAILHSMHGLRAPGQT